MMVDCGAREVVPDLGILAAFPRATLIGFEPDSKECARLNQTSKGQCMFFPVAVGQRSETRTFYITRRREASSLYVPNVEFFGKFLGYLKSKALEVVDTAPVQVVSLDSYFPVVGIKEVDFLKLDVQGAELDVLRGSESFLQSSVLGMKIEVEFTAIYQDQPLFAEVDAYVRRFGFMLFDFLSLVRYRREVLPGELDTRGQLLWGDTLYLRDYQYFIERSMKLEAMKLAVLASAYGFHDYALEILQFLLRERRDMLTDAEIADLEQARSVYLLELSRIGRLEQLVRWMAHSPLRPVLKKLVRLYRRIQQIYLQ